MIKTSFISRSCKLHSLGKGRIMDSKTVLEHAKELYKKHWNIATKEMTDRQWQQASTEYKEAWILIAAADLNN